MTRDITIRDSRGGTAILDARDGVTVGQMALEAAALLGARVGDRDRATLALGDRCLHATDPLPGDDEFELVVIGGTV